MNLLYCGGFIVHPEPTVFALCFICGGLSGWNGFMGERRRGKRSVSHVPSMQSTLGVSTDDTEICSISAFEKYRSEKSKEPKTRLSLVFDCQSNWLHLCPHTKIEPKPLYDDCLFADLSYG